MEKDQIIGLIENAIADHNENDDENIEILGAALIDGNAEEPAMRTSINGEVANWSKEISNKWAKAVPDKRGVRDSNYYTPRPYKDQYDRGSMTEGFTYTVNRGDGTGTHVCFVVINRDRSDPRRPWTGN